MSSAFSTRILPWLGHAFPGHVNRLSRAAGGPAALAGRLRRNGPGLLDQDWGMQGVAWPAFSVYGHGTFRSRVMVLRLPVASVAALLPSGLSLVPRSDENLHPVVLLFGRQSDVRANIWPFRGWTYNEAAIAVPDVQGFGSRYAYQGPFAYMPRLWLDHLAPVLAGVLFYGYPKRLDRIGNDASSYAVHDPTGGLLAQATFQDAGPARPPHDFPAWPEIERLLDQPLVAEPISGIEIASVLSFRTFAIRRIRPLTAALTLAPQAVPGFAGGAFAASGVTGLPAAFAFESHWRITPPMPRGWLKPTPPQPAPVGPDTSGITWAPPRKRRIAVLGGGVGAMTAAWALTRDPGWQDLYEVTVYQAGWRLGGKGASGRNAAMGQRIEEHGLHIWAGFYENAFRMMRAVYAELARPAGTPLATVADAFKPHTLVTLTDDASGAWRDVTMNIPILPGEPGEGDAELPATPLQYLPGLLDMLDRMLPHTHAPVRTALVEHPLRAKPWARAAVGLAKRAGHKAQSATAAPVSGLSEARAVAAHAAQPGTHRPLQLLATLRMVRDLQNTQALRQSLDGADGMAQMFLHAIDLGLATIVGIIVDRLFFKGFAAADDQEWKAWLRKHGARPQSVESALVRATYDYVFGFAEGDTARPALAAGTTTHGVLRLMLTYRGAFFWAMQAGMGDTIFAPLYQVLRTRGVQFRYFHRVRHLGLAADRQNIDTIEIARQARPLDQDQGYDPLVDVNALPCWPSAPLFDRLADGAALRDSGADLEHEDGPQAEALTLRRGADFDDVLLGISLGALPEICRDLIDAAPRWRAMVDRVKTVATLGVQLWFDTDLAGLGWRQGQTIATAYVEPLDTWADMSWLLPREKWPPGEAPGSVSYLCGTLADAAGSGPKPVETAIAKGIATDWLASSAGHLWPSVSRAGALDHARLFAPGGGTAQQRFDAQYFRANTRGSERYVQTVPGSTEARLRPGESGFDNLWLAGDWVRTGMNAGCVEAGAMSGLAAAAAITSEAADIVDGETVPLAGSLVEHALESVHGVSLTDALVVAASLDLATARGLLPDGLAFAPQAMAPEGQVPVAVIVARHRDARLNVMPLGLGFREMLVLLPAIRPAGVFRPFALPGPYAYAARHVLDSHVMMALGRSLYGDLGRYGRFRAASGGGERVHSGTGSLLLSVDATPVGRRTRAAACHHYAAMQWLLGRPLLSRAPRGGWRMSRIDWQLPQASVQGLTVELTALPALRLDRAPRPWRVASGEAGLLSAFRIWTQTTRSNPLLGLNRRSR